MSKESKMTRGGEIRIKRERGGDGGRKNGKKAGLPMS